jgi:hypothetical protein
MKTALLATLAAVLIAAAAPAHAGLIPDPAKGRAAFERAACTDLITKAYSRVEAKARDKFCGCIATELAALPAEALDGRRRNAALVQANGSCGLVALIKSAPRKRRQ